MAKSDTSKPLAIPANEMIRGYEPGSTERDHLKQALESVASERTQIPAVIGGKELRGAGARRVVMPHAHAQTLATYDWCDEATIQRAIESALKAKPAWEAMAWQDRAGIFIRAADLLSNRYRDQLNAATMLGQSKNAYQAEIDAACELLDFLRFNAYFYQEIQKNQPLSTEAAHNRLEYRPLEGFVAAITPFNFTAIAGNLPAVPAMLGNTVLWKPSDTQMLSAHVTMSIFREAGLPDGVINFVPADGPTFGKVVLKHRELAGVHFTGSTGTFQHIWKTVGESIASYRGYPRLVGETGGKDFVFVHPSADWEAAATALVRGAFEYQGQKCSAASRAYIPRSLWPRIQEKVLANIAQIRMGDVRDFTNFMNAVIDERSFNKISSYLEFARTAVDAKVLAGGRAHGETGYFIEPTLIQTENPRFKTMVEEIFGPVLTVFVYEDSRLDETLTICDESSPYALTGAIIAQDRGEIDRMTARLRHSAGNFYINDKPTGAVVGQQPFGGARASGTNDKAGSSLNLLRFVSPRTIKETLHPPHDFRYPFMGAK